MATIKFFIQSDKSPAGIYVRLRDGVAIDAKAKTRYSIDPDDWSAKKEQPKNLKDASFKSLAADLTAFKSELLKHYNSSVGKVAINSEWLKEFVNPIVRQDRPTEKLTDYFEFYIERKRNGLTLSSIKKLRVVKHLLMRYQSSARKDILLKNVDLDFKQRFEQYCVNEGYSHNTIAKAIQTIKFVCLDGRTNSIDTSFQLDSISVKYKKTPKIYLSHEEIQEIEKAELEHDYQINARDWLLISCETGQRISDFMRFRKEMIREENGKKLIEFTQQKTNKLMTVPLSKKVQAILKKRKGEFPRQISDQKYNDYIKEVCKAAKLTQKIKGTRINPETNRKESGTFEKWELVSSHIGRRSFATNNYGRIPTSLLIGATGHSTEKQFLEYIGKTDTQKAMQLAEYF